jgi:uncharacterized membrane protein
MEKVLNLGRWIFPLSFLMYVGLHFGKPEVGASFVPDFLPFPYFWNYLTALCIIAFIISALIRKYDKLAYSLMALYVILMALLVHLPMALGNLPVDMMGTDVARTQELEMINVFRNIMVTGALLGFAKYVAEDNRIIR